MTTTVIKDAAWVIAWDEGASRQIFPTKTMRSSATAMSHMTGLYERSQAFSAPNDMARAASAEFAYCELLLSGVTSLVDISPAWNGWVELLAESGLRGFLAPGYASARWRLDNDYAVGFTWDEALGREAFAAALGLVDRAGQHPCRRLSGIVSPMQIDTCTAEPLRDSRDAARKRRLPFTVHVAQSVAEVQEMLHRHGKTPVQWADAIRHPRTRNDPRPRAVSRHPFVGPDRSGDHRREQGHDPGPGRCRPASGRGAAPHAGDGAATRLQRAQRGPDFAIEPAARRLTRGSVLPRGEIQRLAVSTKQMIPDRGRLHRDCFVAALLAMTEPSRCHCERSEAISCGARGTKRQVSRTGANAEP